MVFVVLLAAARAQMCHCLFRRAAVRTVLFPMPHAHASPPVSCRCRPLQRHHSHPCTLQYSLEVLSWEGRNGDSFISTSRITDFLLLRQRQSLRLRFDFDHAGVRHVAEHFLDILRHLLRLWLLVPPPLVVSVRIGYDRRRRRRRRRIPNFYHFYFRHRVPLLTDIARTISACSSQKNTLSAAV